MVSPRLRIAFGSCIALLMIGGPLGYRAVQNRHSRGFHVVVDGTLYRSAQLTPTGLTRVVHDYGIKTVICLRHGETKDDQTEEAYCAANGIGFVRMPPRNWGPINGIVPAEGNIDKFLSVVRDPARQPVLIHCFAGMHRTGAYVALYRMEEQGWSNAKAMAEIRALGYSAIEGDLDVFEFLQTYQAGRRGSVSAVPVNQRKRD